MATAVLSVRVDEDIKRAVDRILEREGRTAGEVIRDVWIDIYETGTLPAAHESDELLQERRRRFQAFMDWRNNQPPSPEWLVTMTDREMNDLIAEEQMKKWGYDA